MDLCAGCLVKLVAFLELPQDTFIPNPPPSQKDAPRRSLTGPILVGLIPSFSGSGKKIKRARLQLWHWCMSQLVEDLQAGCAGVEFAARFGTLHSMRAPNRTCSLFLAAAGLLGRFER